MRIIAGEKRGTLIVAPKGMDTRPTLDRVREALFGILQYDIADAVVLDLFAGSGAIGLEAISRGAGHSVINDLSKEAFAAIEANVKKLGFAERTTLYRLDYATAIMRAAASGKRFDVVYIDPPYKSGLIAPAMQTLARAKALKENTFVVAEHAGTAKPPDVEGFTLADTRRYGEAAISFYREAHGQ